MADYNLSDWRIRLTLTTPDDSPIELNSHAGYRGLSSVSLIEGGVLALRFAQGDVSYRPPEDWSILRIKPA